MTSIVFPEIFGIPSYQFFHLCATIAAIIYITLTLKIKPRRYAFYIGIISIFLSLFAARLLWVSYDLDKNFNLETIFRLRYGSFDLGGAFLAFPICLIIGHKIFKVEYKELFNTLVEALIIYSMIAKIACFCAGCCCGKISDVPWAVRMRHPVQLYESAVWLIVLIATLLTKNKMSNVNRVCLIGIGCICMRMPVEYFRKDAYMFINGGYWLTYKVLLVVCVVTLIIYNRNKIKQLFNKVVKNDKKIE